MSKSETPLASEFRREDILLVRTGQFRDRVREIIGYARDDGIVVVHTGPEPRALIRRELELEEVLPWLDEVAIQKKPRKYIFEALKGRRFVLVDENSSGRVDQVVLQPAGPEWKFQALSELNMAAQRERSRVHYSIHGSQIQTERRQRRKQDRQKVIQHRADSFAKLLSARLGQTVEPFVELGLLSEREKQVACLLLQGCSIKQIASQLEVATGAVRTARSRLLRKLDISPEEGIDGLKGLIKVF